jgi:DeoR family suf operon transcriptional repressor
MTEPVATRVAPPLPESRRAVLYAVRRRGEATAEEIAGQLGMTLSGARQHLSALVAEELLNVIEAPRLRGSRGRRRLLYSVSELGDSFFPKAYGELTNELLDYLSADEPQLVERLFARRREHRIANARRRLDPLPTLEAKVSELARVLDEDGYLASWEPAGPSAYRVVEHNCAIWAVARRYGQACISELDFIRAVLPGADVERVQHMVEGARHCAYEIRADSA